MSKADLEALRQFWRPDGEPDPARAKALVAAFRAEGAEEQSVALLLHRPMYRKQHKSVLARLKS